MGAMPTLLVRRRKRAFYYILGYEFRNITDFKHKYDVIKYDNQYQTLNNKSIIVCWKEVLPSHDDHGRASGMLNFQHAKK